MTTVVVKPADRPIVRAAVGVAMLGAGLIHIAVAAQQGPAALAVLVVIGAAELVFCIGSLSSRIPVTTLTIVLACVPIMLWAVLILCSSVLGIGAALPVGPMLAAAALNLVAALSLAASARFSRPDRTAPRPWAFTLSLVVSAALLPFIAVPAMSSAQYPAGDAPSMSQIHEHHH